MENEMKLNPAREALNRAVNRAKETRKVDAPAACYVCRGTCLGHDAIEPGDVFESTSGNVWQVVRTEDREAGQYAEVFATSKPEDHYFWHTDSLRLMRRLEPSDPKHPVWEEYDRAASDLARKGLTGAKGDPLPNLMTPEAVSLINSDPEAFQQRVKGFAYAYLEDHNIQGLGAFRDVFDADGEQ
jgi:hypothetical protein